MVQCCALSVGDARWILEGIAQKGFSSWFLFTFFFLLWIPRSTHSLASFLDTLVNGFLWTNSRLLTPPLGASGGEALPHLKPASLSTFQRAYPRRSESQLEARTLYLHCSLLDYSPSVLEVVASPYSCYFPLYFTYFFHLSICLLNIFFVLPIYRA